VGKAVWARDGGREEGRTGGCEDICCQNNMQRRVDTHIYITHTHTHHTHKSKHKQKRDLRTTATDLRIGSLLLLFFFALFPFLAVAIPAAPPLVNISSGTLSKNHVFYSLL